MSARLPADLPYMRQALALSRSGLGQVWPNPSVGCVIVSGARVVASARTAPGGRPHAEVAAVALAGAAARGATAYVSLEPCSHWGVTPPCVEALIAAGVARVVVAVKDPDPRVDGRGIAALRAAGIAVEVGLCADEAGALHAGFFQRARHGRPLVARLARAEARSLSVLYDAELRGPGCQPARHAALVLRLDPALRGPLGPAPGAQRTWLLTGSKLAEGRVAALEVQGVEVVALEEPESLHAVLQRLGQRGLTRLCVGEDDPLATRLEAQKLLDRDRLQLGAEPQDPAAAAAVAERAMAAGDSSG